MDRNRNKAPRDQDEERRDDGITDGPEVPSSLDMQDSRADEERLRQETTYINLPEVSDIPGQENITSAGIPGAMRDTTISSDDEEGIVGGQDVLDEDEDTKIVMGTEADVTAEDLAMLGPREGDMDLGDDELTRTEGLDDTDFDGEQLNEASTSEFSTGEDLDLPSEAGSDPLADAMGQGDEENDYYSLGSDDNDNMTEGTP